MIWRVLILLICSVVVAKAQRTAEATAAYRAAVAFRSAIFSPTNIVGATNLSWWIADGQALTNANGAVSNLLDAGLSPINLTNLAASSAWPTVSNNMVNGHAMLHYPIAAAYLNSVNYTSPQPHTVVMVVRWWPSTISGARYYYDSTDATKRHNFNNNSGLFMSSGTITAIGVITTNKWQVVELVHNGAASGFYSNNVSAGTYSTGTQVAQGFVLGNARTFAGGGYIDVAEVLTYNGTLGAIDSAGTFGSGTYRYALYNYLTNLYGITQ